MDLSKAYFDIGCKASRGYVRFHAGAVRSRPVVAKILQRFGMLQECVSVKAPVGEVFAYASAESFATQVPIHKLIALASSRYARFLHVTVYRPAGDVTRHDKWQASFDPSGARVLCTYLVSDLQWTPDEDE